MPYPQFAGDHLGMSLRPARRSLLQSVTSISIYDLPPEILSHIFLATINKSPGCYQEQKLQNCIPPTTLSSVCRAWRRVSLDLPPLWACIDLVVHRFEVNRTRLNYLDILTKRSGSSPIDLHIWVHEALDESGLNGETRGLITELNLAGLADVFAPLMARIEGLHISSKVYSASELQAILVLAIRLSAVSSLETLSINAAYQDLEASSLLDWRGLNLLQLPNNILVDKFLRPVRSLLLQNSFIPTNSSVYHDLVELSLVSDGAMQLPTTVQMSQVLASCPKLRRLSLTNLYAVDSGQPPVEPVHLHSLQYLDLTCKIPQRLAPFLQILHPASQQLIFKMCVSEELEFVQHFHAFLSRSSMISDLRVQPSDAKAWFSSLRELPERVTTLTLEGCDFADSNLESYVRTQYVDGSLPWPFLRSLNMNCCTINLDALECLIGSRYLERLVFRDCEVQEPCFEGVARVTAPMIERRFAHSDMRIVVYDEKRD